MRRLMLVLLLFCVVPSLSFVNAEDTPTFLNIEDMPPYVIQNFSDINLLAGVPSVDYLDLDDYFQEDNGDTLNITWETDLENVTIIVNSEHLVSFYPDAGFIGAGQLRFIVADNAGNATGNWFTVTIGDDTQPPKWFNPLKDKSSVYQNSVVNFSATWTDNLGLDHFIFSIDQGTNWVNSSAISFTGIANQSIFSTIISAPPGSTVGWRFYAQDEYGNWNVTPVKEFTVTSFDYNTPDDTVDDTGENSIAEDLASILYSPDTVSEASATNFKVDPSNIKLSLRQGDEISKTVRVTNTGQNALEFTTDISSLEYFTVVSDSGFLLEPGETKDLILEFKIPDRIMPDQYFGFLRIEADETIDIPIILDIREFESEISINVFIPEKYKTTRAGKEAKAVVTIVSTKDLREANLSVFYAIKNFKGDILESNEMNVELFSSFEDVFVLTVPQETLDGEYLFYVRATGKDLIDIGSDTFFVGARFRILRILQHLFYPLLFLIAASIVVILILVYKRNKDKQKALELYIMLNEMRGFVKQGKMEDAVEIYKRIKVAYRQHISSDFQKDKEKLKVELNKFAELLNQNPIAEGKSIVPAKPAAAPAVKGKASPPNNKKPTQLAPQKNQENSIVNKASPIIKNIVKKILPLNAVKNQPITNQKPALKPAIKPTLRPQKPVQQKIIPTLKPSVAPKLNPSTVPKQISKPQLPNPSTVPKQISKPQLLKPALQPTSKPIPKPVQPVKIKKEGDKNESQTK